MNRYFYPYWKWECFQYGMFSTSPPSGSNADDCRQKYQAFLADITQFEIALERVLLEWPISCRQFLSNDRINRIAWLGQASACLAIGLPRHFRNGFFLLSRSQQCEANNTANIWLERWIANEHKAQDRAIYQDMEKSGIQKRHSRRNSHGVDERQSCAIIQGNLFSAT